MWLTAGGLAFRTNMEFVPMFGETSTGLHIEYSLGSMCEWRFESGIRLERRTCWRTEDFKAFGCIARRDEDEC
jgi:hypothetical protein